MSRKTGAWNRTRQRGKRKANTRNPRKKILIVCEGEKTEPHYFTSFPVDKQIVEVDIRGEGKNTDSLVQEAIHLQADAEKRGEPYNQTWCVFDRDAFPKQNFKRAIRLAVDHKIRVAYSNQAFELWYLLHFCFFVDAADRRQYAARLSKWLGHPYTKNSATIYAELLEKQPRAIKHAQKLLNEYHPRDPEANNPSTTVHLLVEELNKHCESQ